MGPDNTPLKDHLEVASLSSSDLATLIEILLFIRFFLLSPPSPHWQIALLVEHER